MRTSPSPSGRTNAGGGWRARARRVRFLWSASEAYSGWLLRRIPRCASTALDVGCGRGDLAARLAARGMEVDALDLEAKLVAQARRTHRDVPVRWIVGDFFAEDAPLRSGGYDVVIAVASVHQEPVARALERLGSLVRPGGRLLVVGLYRAASWRDTTLSAIALPLHAARGLLGRAPRRGDVGLPVAPPVDTLREIRRVAAALLRTARIRRRLFWRFTLEWSSPPQPHA